MDVKVSVILPSLNVAGYIRECLESVVGQSLRELEAICVDAGSTDGTAEVLAEYAGRDPRVVVLHSDLKSYGRQVNMGLDRAKGEYVAVLETDDWVEGDMYRRLYQRAAADGLDYAAADFDTVTRLQNGFDYLARQRVFPDREPGAGPEKPGRDWYGRVLGPGQIAALRASDYALWRGIYSREFLDANGVRLHESPGAAFQDMGFLQQVKSRAKRAAYLDESFYRYRQGRDAASSGSLEGLRYYEGEFRWLEGLRGFAPGLAGDHERYYYFTMSIAFLTKYEQILSGLGGDWRDERLLGPYGWFRSRVSQAVERGLLQEPMYGGGTWGRLLLLLSSREAHAAAAAEGSRKENDAARELGRMTGGRPAVIFGCGRRGERLMLFCDRHGVRVDAFCDNNAALHGKRRFGFEVVPPSGLAGRAEDRDAVVLLSMKEGAEEVRAQLAELGLEEGRVVGRLPDGVL